MGQTMTYEEAVKCAGLFRRHADEIDGIIVCLPNFGEETGIAGRHPHEQAGLPHPHPGLRR